MSVMVYETKTLKICHQLTELGKERYSEMLEHEADMILFKHQHPFKWLVSKIVEAVKQ